MKIKMNQKSNWIMFPNAYHIWTLKPNLQLISTVTFGKNVGENNFHARLLEYILKKNIVISSVSNFLGNFFWPKWTEGFCTHSKMPLDIYLFRIRKNFYCWLLSRVMSKFVSAGYSPEELKDTYCSTTAYLTDS